MIVDYLHDDKDLLAACALVSKSWHSTARYHPFRSLRINIGVEDGSQDGFETFSVFLDEAFLDVRNYIRNLCLSGSDPPQTSSSYLVEVEVTRHRAVAKVGTRTMSKMLSQACVFSMNPFWSSLYDASLRTILGDSSASTTG